MCVVASFFIYFSLFYISNSFLYAWIISIEMIKLRLNEIFPFGFYVSLCQWLLFAYKNFHMKMITFYHGSCKSQQSSASTDGEKKLLIFFLIQK